MHKVPREVQYDDFEKNDGKRILSFVESSDIFFALFIFGALYEELMELFVGRFYS